MSGNPARQYCRKQSHFWVFCLFMFLSAESSLAEVVGTHHDLSSRDGADGKSACAYCHVPHNAKSEQNLFSRPSRDIPELGSIGSFCYSCHDGTISPGALVEAPNGSQGIDVLVNSHGLDIAGIKQKTNGLETVDNIVNSGLLRSRKNKNEDQGMMECTTCHDVHSNKYPPFLRMPIDSLCTSCHSGKNFEGTGRWNKIESSGKNNGPHPIGMHVKYSGNDKVKDIPAEMRFREPDGAFTHPLHTSEELTSLFTHWEIGGHLTRNEKLVTCVTCHSAHMPAANLLAAAESQDIDSTVCSGCHGTKETPQNPGTTEWYHPVLQESLPPYWTSTQPGFVLLINIPTSWPIGSRGELLCITCHTAHGGVPGQKLIRVSDRGNRYICNNCHVPNADNTPVDSHHIMGEEDYSNTPPYAYTNPSWWDGEKGSVGDLSDGLVCVDCHTELAKSAHNW